LCHFHRVAILNSGDDMGFALAEVLVPLAQHDFDGKDIGINWAEYGFVLQKLCMDHF
jgi:hypothetical protein